MTTRLLINEVAPRDGLQMERRFVPTPDKIAFVDALSACGFAKIEVTSFTSPRAIPALADAEIVMREIRRAPGVVYTALVPNLRGMERAIESRVDELNLVMSCSESHNVANLRMTRAGSLAQLLEIVAQAARGGIRCNVSLSTAFGCPFEGDVAVDEVARIGTALMDGGAAGLTLCDTTGMADPHGVRGLMSRMADVLPVAATTIHLHDTRGMALANALAALDMGATRFDASCAGLGGCPFAPGASGNVNTETLVHMFECMGRDTGVDLARLLEIAATVPALIDRPLANALLAAGPRSRLHPMPA
jgi:hydroxymethylglutaryl-CoA lyase